MADHQTKTDLTQDSSATPKKKTEQDLAQSNPADGPSGEAPHGSQSENPGKKAKGNKADKAPEQPKLQPLVPCYDQVAHEKYVAALENGLKDEIARNIALTGPYGVGKSSILSELTRRKANLRPVVISLSTLDLRQQISQQDRTAYLQKEIVKQLIYRERPSALPNSRFRRISKTSIQSSVIFALITSGMLLSFIPVSGHQPKLAPLSEFNFERFIETYAVPYVLYGVVLYLLHNALLNRLWIERLSSGSSEITISQNGGKLFDEHLDELVYFFEASGTRLVIFEDLDRFDDFAILEDLRNLNMLLNNSNQISGTVRFVYAVGDSIFRLDASEQGKLYEAASARTKFFDLVVPVVPFLTHQNSRKLLGALLLEQECVVSPDLVRLVSRHISDMRLLKNIVNEFVVFKPLVVPSDKATELSSDNLFALVVYKNLYLEDFERIRAGSSNLDALYEYGRGIVAWHVDKLEQQISEATELLRRVDGVRKRSNELGSALLRVVSILPGISNHGGVVSSTSILVDRSPVSEDYVQTVEFWRDVAVQGKSLLVQFTYGRGHQTELSLPMSSLSILLGVEINAEHWEALDRDELQGKIVSKRSQIEELRKADFRQLVSMPPTGAEGVHAPNMHFAGELNRRFGVGIAQDLIRNGYIDQYFTLYSSVSHGDTLTTAARAFAIRCLDRREPDFQIELNEADIGSLLAHYDPDAFDNVGVYSIKLIDYLLKSNGSHFRAAMSSFESFGDVQSQFLRAYLTGGDGVEQLFMNLAGVATWCFKFLIGILDVELGGSKDYTRVGQRTIDALNGCLRGLNADMVYEIPPGLGSWIAGSAADLSVLKEARGGDTRFEKLLYLLQSTGVQFKELGLFSESFRDRLADIGAFEVSLRNVDLIVGHGGERTLNYLRVNRTPVYHYLIKQASLTVGLSRSGFLTIHHGIGQQELVAILRDLEGVDQRSAFTAVSSSGEDWKVERLEELPSSLWQVLLEGDKVFPTLGNAFAYRVAFGMDSKIGKWLSRSVREIGRNIEQPPLGEEARVDFAYDVLGAGSVLPDARLRARLARLILNGSRLELDLRVEDGPLVGFLIREGVLADSRETFRWLMVNYSVRSYVFAVKRSRRFLQFVNSECIDNERCVEVLGESRDLLAVRRHIVENYHLFLDFDQKGTLDAFLRNAVELNVPVLLDVLRGLVRSYGYRDELLILLVPYLHEVGDAALGDILRGFGPSWADLLNRDRKRPKFERSESVQALLERLVDLRLISSFKISGSKYEVHKLRR